MVVKDEFGKSVAPSDKISTQDVRDGIFRLYGYAIKNGSANSAENSYSIYAQYSWDRGPLNYYTDTLTMVWQSKVTPYRSPYSVHNWRSGGAALAILSYFSIDFSGAGQQEYTDRFNFSF